MTGLQNSRKMWILCLLLALITFALYSPVHRFEFVDFDDPEYIFNEPVVRGGLSWWGLVWSFVDAHSSNWHPLTWLSHMLDCQLFGLNPGPHHLVNAVLHCANAVLLLAVLLKMTGALWRSVFVAAIFAWHPLRVESVAWISERKDVLSGLFFMLTLWAYTEFASHSRNQSPKSNRWFCYTLVFFTFGLLSKPMLVTVPFVLLLLDFWPLRRAQDEEWRLPGVFISKPVRVLVAEKIPFFALALVFSVITFLAQRASGAVVAMSSLGVESRIGFFLTGYLGYLEKLFWPGELAFLYLRPAAVPWSEVMLATLVLAGVSILAAANLRRRPYLIVGWLWFFGMLVPVSNLVQVGMHSIADRYTYLPAIGIAIVLAWGGGDLAQSFLPKRRQEVLIAVAASVLLLASLCLTWRQLGYWQNTQTLMERALKLDPNNHAAHRSLLAYFTRHGQNEKARFHYQRAMELDPGITKKPGQSHSEPVGKERISAESQPTNSYTRP